MINFASLFYNSAFFLLFMGPTALFGTIYGSHCTISSNFYFYLQYFQQKVLIFSKISGSQTDPKWAKNVTSKLSLILIVNQAIGYNLQSLL